MSLVLFFSELLSGISDKLQDGRGRIHYWIVCLGSRLNETDFESVIVGFSGWSRKRNCPENISPFVLERRVLSGNMVQYYFNDEILVYQRNLLVYR